MSWIVCWNKISAVAAVSFTLGIVQATLGTVSENSYFQQHSPWQGLYKAAQIFDADSGPC